MRLSHYCCILKALAAFMIIATIAQAQKADSPRQKQHRYKVIDLSTLGGPISYGSVNGDGFRLLNDSGSVASYADLAVSDPNASFFCYDLDCYQAHATVWKHGEISDLGALAGNNNSAAGSINSRGWATGQSQSSTIDPALGIPEFHATLWKHEKIVDLGTLGDGTESLGIFVNDAGQAVGFSTINTEPDPVGFAGFPTHTFIWRDGQKVDIGTLGGNDTFPGASCSHPPEGMVWGSSTTSTATNSDTGIPTVDPYIWDHGKMTDLGTLGGTNGFVQCVNSWHEAIGMSNLAGDITSHAFLWRNGRMKDLGTLGGDDSEAIWMNDAGVIAGSADLPTPGIHDAVRWKDGHILDLGTVDGDPCSRGRAINAKGQIVGGSSDCSNFLHAFVWEEGGPMHDLNQLIRPGSGLQLTNAFNINDQGEILAKSVPLGVAPIDDEDLGHLVLLVPCDEEGENCETVLRNAGPNQSPADVVHEHLGERTAGDPLRTLRGRLAARRRTSINSETR